MGVTTVKDEWALAKAWLHRELRETPVTPREWDQVKRLFAKAKDLEVEQAPISEQACRNADIRREVKSR